MQDAMYKRAGELFANELYDELTASGLLEDRISSAGRPTARFR